ETLDELARLSFPNADGAMPIGAGQVLPIRADGHDVKRGDMALRRSLVVALQRSYRPTRLSIPQFDKHIVAGVGQQVAGWRDGEIAPPACVSIHASLRLAVAPPDQLAVEAGRDKERFHNDDGGNVVIVLRPACNRFLLVGGQVKDMNGIIVAASVEAWGV